jgi:tRNA-dihydrouridine synthase
MEERFGVVVEHSEHFENLCGRSRFMAMRKHLTWYCRSFRGASEMRARMTQANSAEDVRQCLAEFMNCGSATAARRPFSDHKLHPDSILPDSISRCD